ncbi:MAG: AtpZ/AtpI family protein [Parvularcula sp.]|jgi:F0F1-type ATP synthase assembly protein I|nr:AtpZ/AtpI family protein [Parvularcula sp.]
MSDPNDKRSELDQLGDRLTAARKETEPKVGTTHGAAAGDGLRIAIEFVVSVLVGTGLGYAIGAYFGAPVVGLLLGLPFGFAAGLRTVYRGMVAGETKDDDSGTD